MHIFQNTTQNSPYNTCHRCVPTSKKISVTSFQHWSKRSGLLTSIVCLNRGSTHTYPEQPWTSDTVCVYVWCTVTAIPPSLCQGPVSVPGKKSYSKPVQRTEYWEQKQLSHFADELEIISSSFRSLFFVWNLKEPGCFLLKASWCFLFFFPPLSPVWSLP